MPGMLDPADGYVVLRWLCAAFFVPHIVGKLSAREASVAFFAAAGSRPAQFWSYASMIVEMGLATTLILAVCLPWTAFVASFYLLVAGAANYRVSRKWLWHIGGSEWCVFWSACCAIVAVYGAAN